jgi:hypothetical protein
MRLFEPSKTQNRSVERPTCERCNSVMWLARIQPSDEPDHDHRTFECPTCQTATVTTVKFK